ncbi:phage virion morphogenesis protein [Collimonas humicola]|uniref:phage virion morphogenesis protein n=1 Tax=Collimonas humicola TaxID=2825886 RepID=UPI002E799C3D|nr:phage virion morphogenesis protein [Collimonas humicola]
MALCLHVVARQGHKKGPTYHYPARPLLGFSVTDQALINDSLLRHLPSPREREPNTDDFSRSTSCSHLM